MIANIIIFTILQLINVMLSTVKNIVQIKGTKLVATIANSIYYAYYTVVVIFMVSDFVTDPTLNVVIKVVITFFANVAGTYISMTILEKVRKDKLWKIELTVDTKLAESLDLAYENIPHSYIKITNKHTLFTFYCRTKEESKKVSEIVKLYNAHYFVSENKISL